MKENGNNNNQAAKDNQPFISLKNDYAFTQIMKNKIVLQGFLSAVLEVKAEDILDIHVEDRYLNKTSFDGKLGILDVRLNVNGFGDINIELQVQPYAYWEERSIFYTSTMYIEDVKKGQGYDQCRKVIHISILGFNFCKDTDYFYSSFHIREDERNFLYSDTLEFHVIELGKLTGNIKEKHLALYRWACLINTESEEERMDIEKDPYLKEALKELEELSHDPERISEYNARDIALRDYVTQMYSAKEVGKAEGKAEGLAEGKAEGKAEGRIEGEAVTISIICRKIKSGLNPELIAEWTELPLVYVNKIAEIYTNHPEYSSKEIANEYMKNLSKL